jgi:hypothetical protein
MKQENTDRWWHHGIIDEKTSENIYLDARHHHRRWIPRKILLRDRIARVRSRLRTLYVVDSRITFLVDLSLTYFHIGSYISHDAHARWILFLKWNQ